MKCPYCSAEVISGAIQCPSCGGPLDQVSPAQSEFESIPEAFPRSSEQPKPISEAPTPPPEPVAPDGPTAASPPAFSIPSDRSMLAIVSIVLGVFGLMFSCLPVCGIPLAIVGLVLGGMGRSTKLRGWAYGGMALNALSILIGLLMTAAIVLMFVFSPTSTITN